MASISSPITGLAASLDAHYTTQAIVTGQGEEKRQPGLRECLERVHVKVSGDPRVTRRAEMTSLRSRAKVWFNPSLTAIDWPASQSMTSKVLMTVRTTLCATMTPRL